LEVDHQIEHIDIAASIERMSRKSEQWRVLSPLFV
jgi:hypothetical protein